MGFGSIVITSAVGGPTSYIHHEKNGFMVWTNEEICFGSSPDTFSFLLTAHETWQNINIRELRETMRRVYELSDKEEKNIQNEGLKTVYRYSYENTGNYIKGLLDD